jgi:tetratricopeptide (TPR) repeat protein
MTTNRMETLKNMLAQNPLDSFARYGLAMEHANGGDWKNALAEFKVLLENNAGYAAAYFHGGQALEKLGRMEEAGDLYRKGIEVTARSGDRHTQSELQAALDLLPL